MPFNSLSGCDVVRTCSVCPSRHRGPFPNWQVLTCLRVGGEIRHVEANKRMEWRVHLRHDFEAFRKRFLSVRPARRNRGIASQTGFTAPIWVPDRLSDAALVGFTRSYSWSQLHLHDLMVGSHMY